MLSGGKDEGDGIIREFGMDTHTAVFKMGNLQEPTVERRELCRVLCDSLDERGVCGRMDTCVCVAESLHSSPETMTLFVNRLHPNTKVLKNK